MPDDDTPEIDWAMVREVSISLAELLYSYHQALIAVGFNENAALTLTIKYQESWLSNQR